MTLTRTIRFKNTTENPATWVSHTIDSGDYYEIPTQYELLDWQSDVDVFTSVANGDLAVGDSTTWFTDVVYAWNTWVMGDRTPPQSADGDWNILAKDHSSVTGNLGINWTIEGELEAGESYMEKLIVPDGYSATLKILFGSSDRGSFSAHTCWFVEISPGEYMRYNPWIRKEEIINAYVEGAHTTGATVIDIKNTANELNGLHLDHYYQFNTGTSDFFRKVIAIDTIAEQITLNSGIPMDLADDNTLTLTDRPIGRTGSQQGGGSSLTWGSSPNSFDGNGKNFFVLRMVNEDLSYVSVITASLNGWYGPTT